MPTYEYRCEACKHRFEQFQSITAEPVRKCPACAKRRVRRLMGTGAAVLFKGSGFYATDYRSSSYKEGAKKEKGAASGGGGGAKKEKPGDKSGGKPPAKSD